MSTLGTDQKQRTGRSDPGSSLPESLRIAVPHIRLLQNQRRTLPDALVGAELQFLAALRRRATHLARAARGPRHAGGRQNAWPGAPLDGHHRGGPENVVANAVREALGAGDVRKGR